MTDNEIIKALECCCSETIEKTCGDCPLFNVGRPDCYRILANNSLDLINRQQAELEKLKQEYDFTREYIHDNGLEWDLLSRYTRKEEQNV